MSPESNFYDYLEDNLRQAREHGASEALERRYEAERDDREFVRAALQGAVPEDEIERKLLLRSEFVRLNPDRDPNAYARGLIDEEKTSFHALSAPVPPSLEDAVPQRSQRPRSVGQAGTNGEGGPTASPNAIGQTEPKRRKALHTGLGYNRRLRRIREPKPPRQPSDSISTRTSNPRTGLPSSCAIERAGKPSSA